MREYKKVERGRFELAFAELAATDRLPQHLHEQCGNHPR